MIGRILIILVLVFSCSVAWVNSSSPVLGLNLYYIDDGGKEIQIGQLIEDLQKEIELLKERIKSLEKLKEISKGVFINIDHYEWNEDKEQWEFIDE